MSIQREALSSALPGYELGPELGRGTWGIAVEATERQTGRRVVVKQLHATLATNPDVRSRFAEQARRLVALHHPHLAEVIDHGEGGDLCALVVERLDGGSAHDLRVRGASPQAACAVAVAACSGLGHAHRNGVLHRDVTPRNLLLTTDGTVKMSDAGLAEVVGGSRTVATRAGDVLATPAYLAPEQVAGTEPTAATDVYALATVLFQLLSGRLPFSDQGDPVTVMSRRVQEQPADLSAAAPAVPAAVARVVMGGLAADPADRPQTADGFGSELARAAEEAWGPGWLAASGVTLVTPDATTDRTVTAPAVDLRQTMDARTAEQVVPVQDLVPGLGGNQHETVAASSHPPTPPAPPPTVPPPTMAPPRGPAPPAPAPPAAAPSSRRPLVIAGAVAIVAVVALVAFLLARSSGTSRVRTVAVTVPGNRTWTNTGINLAKDDDVTITATGTVLPDKNVPSLAASPAGVPGVGFRRSNIVLNADHSSLIGRIGDTGSPFLVGTNSHLLPSSGGRLFLGVNDVGVENNSGSWHARVKITKRG